MQTNHSASDMWGLGVVAYLMVSGGMSPFWAGSRYRIMARILKCEYNFDLPNFQLVSKNAIDFIQSTLGNIDIRLICHVWFWPYMVCQSTKLSLYMVYQSTNKCWASVPPQYHPSGPWGSLDKSQT